MSLTPSKSSILSYDHITPEQHAAIDAIYERNTLLIAKVGFGKAMVGQTAVQALLDDEVLARVLVVAPLKVCTLTWASEWMKWDHLERPAMAIGDARARKAAIAGGDAIVVINIENLAWLFAEYGADHGFDGLLIDEVSKFKTAGGATMKALRKHLKDFAWRCGMSATPVAEAGVDIYAQALVVDAGAALGRNKDTFMRTYFYPTDFQQRNWALLPGHAPVLAAALKDLIFVADDMGYEAALPELRDCVVNVELPPDALREYDLMCAEGYIDGVEAVNAAVLTGKLQQITAGAVYLDEGERWIHYQKFEALRRVVAEAEGPLLVAYWFQFERDQLRVQYPDMQFLSEGGDEMVQQWNAGEISLMAIHPKSASHGLNLQWGGHEIVLMTPPWGADPFQQLVGRLRRRGQASKYVRRTVIVASGTVDEVVMARHLDKAYDESMLMAHLKGE